MPDEDIELSMAAEKHHGYPQLDDNGVSIARSTYSHKTAGERSNTHVVSGTSIVSFIWCISFVCEKHTTSMKGVNH